MAEAVQGASAGSGAAHRASQRKARQLPSALTLTAEGTNSSTPTVGKHRGIVALEEAVQQRRHAFWVEVDQVVAAVAAKHVVVRERLAVAEGADLLTWQSVW